MKKEWTLTLEFASNQGDRHCYCVKVGEDIARDFNYVKPLSRDPIERMLDGRSFEAAVEVLKTKQFRKDLFIAESKRLGALLAEYMEDKEGWHGEDRQQTILEREKSA